MDGGYDNELKGALFKNKNKREGKQDADYQGAITLFGLEFWQNAWLNKSKAGETYMGQSFKPKDPELYEALRKAIAKAQGGDEKPPVQQQAPATQPDFDDDIPF